MFRTLAAAAAAFIVFLAPPAAAQSGRISGTVRDETGAAVPLVEISLRPGDQRTRADSGGNFELTGIPVGTYTVRGRRIGHEPAEIDVAVARDSTSVIALVLRKRPFNLDTVVVSADCARFRFSGFVCRRRQGKGEFLDEESIDALDAGYWGTGDLFWDNPAFRVEVDASGAHHPVAISGWRCLVSLVNGRPANRANPLPAKLDEVIAVEIYADPRDVPSEYGTYVWMERQGRQPPRRCSMIVYWTSIRPR